MPESKITVPQPLAPSLKTLSDPEKTIKASSPFGECLVTFDTAVLAGAVCFLKISPAMWRIYVPISITDFVNSLSVMEITMPDGMDLVRWITAVTTDDSARAN